MIDAFHVKAKGGGIDFKSGKQKELFRRRLVSLEGKDFVLSLDEKKPKRSDQQNRFYWLYIGMISEKTGYTKDELHSFFKGKFLTEKIKDVMGHKVRVTKSTTDLSKNDFSEYIIEIHNLTEIEPPDTKEFFFGD